MVDDELQSRYERAQDDEMTAYIRDRDPLIVEVDNEESGSTYTVLPQSLYCGCPDHRFRDVICKHLLFLGDGCDDDELQDLVAETLDAEHSEVVEEKLELEQMLEDVREEEYRLYRMIELITDNETRHNEIEEWLASLDSDNDTDENDTGTGTESDDGPLVPGPVIVPPPGIVEAEAMVEELDDKLVEDVVVEAEELIEELESSQDDEDSSAETVEGLTMDVVE